MSETLTAIATTGLLYLMSYALIGALLGVFMYITYYPTYLKYDSKYDKHSTLAPDAFIATVVLAWPYLLIFIIIDTSQKIHKCAYCFNTIPAGSCYVKNRQECFAHVF